MPALSISAGAPPRDRIELTGLVALLGFVAARQFSIAAADILLTVVLLAWAVFLLVHRERPGAPAMFWPLVAYAAWTLVSAVFSRDPHVSIVDCKQLVLLLIVPAVYRLARGPRAHTVLSVIITVAAASAVIGIVQYGVLHYDSLGNRPRGLLGHYMTYSGLLMLVTCAAASRLLFGRRERIWPALVLLALLVAISLTFTRSAWVGVCVGMALLLVLKDFRLLAAVPVLVALFIAVAPADVTNRFYSMFDRRDPTSRDRIAMLEAGGRIIRQYPLTGVGPDMVLQVYPEFRSADAVEPRQPHLHNVPMQIAAERGLPALALWVWFIVALSVQLARKFRTDPYRVLPAAGLSAVAAMLAAGMFEYNFGDSEFLMLFLVLATLPYAAVRDGSWRKAKASSSDGQRAFAA
jgi:O-antigen ligase